jgi:hypothetical protein
MQVFAGRHHEANHNQRVKEPRRPLPLFGPILKAWFLCRTQNSQTSVNKVIPN